ncbi:unnamed protein product [Diatraea saccharalis]|uniref:Microtubule-associated protein futsch n=1 Tax=Diatraea saccharalis TaxID=40085 RepID=A0A9P0G399_9NEOP|nr:unnamed protein product [Diatraea saccharalis]
MDHDEERSLSLGTEVSASVPPPSPLTGCYLLAVVGEPHTHEHKEIILQRLVKGLLSWDSGEHQVDLEKELSTLTAQAPEGEEARFGERLIQFASENLVTEILIHPQMNTLMQCMRNLLSSFTRHRHLVHAGYTFAGNGSWIMQDGTFSLADFTDAYQENEVQRVIRAYENSISIDIHCSTSGGGEWAKLPDMPFAKHCKIRVNPTDILDSGSQAIKDFIAYLDPYIVPASLDQLLVASDVVGNIRFSHPTLYVFPGGQGDAALFGINGFNMLVDGGFSRKACWWDFARHLDRLDAVLFTRLNNCSVSGMAAVLRRKATANVYPQIGHFFCNLEERRALASPDGDKDADPLLVSLLQEGSDMMADLRHINLKPQHCYRGPDPINLYHKVGHGTLDMYVLNPSKDSKHVREFLKRWHNSEQKLFEGASVSGQFNFPIPNLVSICALLVWRPANPDDTITRIMFPGSTPQHKIFEGLEKLKHLEFLHHPTCTGRQMAETVPPTTTTTTTTFTTATTKSTKQVSSRASKEKHILTDKTKEEKIVEPEPPPLKDAIVKDETDSKNMIDNKLLSELVEGEEKKIESVLQDAITARIETKLDDKLAQYESTVLDGLSKKKEVKKKEKVSEKRTKRFDKIEDLKEPVVKPTESKKADIDSKSKSEMKKRIESKIKTDSVPSSTRSKTSHRVVLKSTEKKTIIDKKSPPITPKKVLETKTVTSTIQSVAKERLKTKTRKLSPSSTPAKSAKEASNRRVMESKYKQGSPKRDLSQKQSEKKELKPKREPISRRPRPLASPIKGLKVMKSPTKSAKVPKADMSKLKGLQRVNYEDILKDAKKSDEDTSKSLDEIKQQELDEKEEQEIVREIEAVFNRDSETEEKVEYVGRSDIEKITCMLDDTKTTADGEFEEEYLIIEKEEVEQFTEDSVIEHESSQDNDGDELQKHLKDKEESEKRKDEKIIKIKTDTLAEFESDQKQTESKEHSVSVEEKQDISSEKKTSESKSGVPKPKDSLELNIVQESQPDEKISTTIESGATTAPTLPEDERITLDDIKENQIIEEKYIKEEKKEIIPPQTLADVHKITCKEKSTKQESIPAPIREIVKTPDEVADLPLHEEVDYRTYEEKKTPLDEEIFKRKPDLGFVHEIKVPKDLPLPDTDNIIPDKTPKTIEDDVVLKTVQRASHAELVTVTPGSAPESPMNPVQIKTASLPNKELETLKEFDGVEYNYPQFTEKLRETHITTVDSPIRDDIIIIEEVSCMPEKIPSIPEDVEKEIEEERILEITEKPPLSPKDVEKIVADVAEVLKSDKSLEEIMAEKSPVVICKSPESFSKTDIAIASAIEATKMLLIHEKEIPTKETIGSIVITKEISPSRSIASEDVSETSDKTVLSEGKRIKQDTNDQQTLLKSSIKPATAVYEQEIKLKSNEIVVSVEGKEEEAFNAKNSIEKYLVDKSKTLEKDTLSRDISRDINEKRLSITFESAKTLEKLEEKMTDLKRKEEFILNQPVNGEAVPIITSETNKTIQKSSQEEIAIVEQDDTIKEIDEKSPTTITIDTKIASPVKTSDSLFSTVLIKELDSEIEKTAIKDKQVETVLSQSYVSTHDGLERNIQKIDDMFQVEYSDILKESVPLSIKEGEKQLIDEKDSDEESTREPDDQDIKAEQYTHSLGDTVENISSSECLLADQLTKQVYSTKDVLEQKFISSKLDKVQVSLEKDFIKVTQEDLSKIVDGECDKKDSKIESTILSNVHDLEKELPNKEKKEVEQNVLEAQISPIDKNIEESSSLSEKDSITTTEEVTEKDTKVEKSVINEATDTKTDKVYLETEEEGNKIGEQKIIPITANDIEKTSSPEVVESAPITLPDINDKPPKEIGNRESPTEKASKNIIDDKTFTLVTEKVIEKTPTQEKEDRAPIAVSLVDVKLTDKEIVSPILEKLTDTEFAPGKGDQSEGSENTTIQLERESMSSDTLDKVTDIKTKSKKETSAEKVSEKEIEEEKLIKVTEKLIEKTPLPEKEDKAHVAVSPVDAKPTDKQKLSHVLEKLTDTEFAPGKRDQSEVSEKTGIALVTESMSSDSFDKVTDIKIISEIELTAEKDNKKVIEKTPLPEEEDRAPIAVSPVDEKSTHKGKISDVPEKPTNTEFATEKEDHVEGGEKAATAFLTVSLSTDTLGQVTDIKTISKKELPAEKEGEKVIEEEKVITVTEKVIDKTPSPEKESKAHIALSLIDAKPTDKHIVSPVLEKSTDTEFAPGKQDQAKGSEKVAVALVFESVSSDTLDKPTHIKTISEKELSAEKESEKVIEEEKIVKVTEKEIEKTRSPEEEDSAPFAVSPVDAKSTEKQIVKSQLEKPTETELKFAPGNEDKSGDGETVAIATVTESLSTDTLDKVTDVKTISKEKLSPKKESEKVIEEEKVITVTEKVIETTPSPEKEDKASIALSPVDVKSTDKQKVSPFSGKPTDTEFPPEKEGQAEGSDKTAIALVTESMSSDILDKVTDIKTISEKQLSVEKKSEKVITVTEKEIEKTRSPEDEDRAHIAVSPVDGEPKDKHIISPVLEKPTDTKFAPGKGDQSGGSEKSGIAIVTESISNDTLDKITDVKTISEEKLSANKESEKGIEEEKEITATEKVTETTPSPAKEDKASIALSPIDAKSIDKQKVSPVSEKPADTEFAPEKEGQAEGSDKTTIALVTERMSSDTLDIATDIQTIVEKELTSEKESKIVIEEEKIITITEKVIEKSPSPEKEVKAPIALSPVDAKLSDKQKISPVSDKPTDTEIEDQAEGRDKTAIALVAESMSSDTLDKVTEIKTIPKKELTAEKQSEKVIEVEKIVKVTEKEIEKTRSPEEEDSAPFAVSPVDAKSTEKQIVKSQLEKPTETELKFAPGNEDKSGDGETVAIATVTESLSTDTLGKITDIKTISAKEQSAEKESEKLFEEEKIITVTEKVIGKTSQEKEDTAPIALSSVDAKPQYKQKVSPVLEKQTDTEFAPRKGDKSGGIEKAAIALGTEIMSCDTLDKVTDIKIITEKELSALKESEKLIEEEKITTVTEKVIEKAPSTEEEDMAPIALSPVDVKRTDKQKVSPVLEKPTDTESTPGIGDKTEGSDKAAIALVTESISSDTLNKVTDIKKISEKELSARTEIEKVIEEEKVITVTEKIIEKTSSPEEEDRTPIAVSPGDAKPTDKHIVSPGLEKPVDTKVAPGKGDHPEGSEKTLIALATESMSPDTIGKVTDIKKISEKELLAEKESAKVIEEEKIITVAEKVIEKTPTPEKEVNMHIALSPAAAKSTDKQKISPVSEKPTDKKIEESPVSEYFTDTEKEDHVEGPDKTAIALVTESMSSDILGKINDIKTISEITLLAEKESAKVIEEEKIFEVPEKVIEKTPSPEKEDKTPIALTSKDGKSTDKQNISHVSEKPTDTEIEDHAEGTDRTAIALVTESMSSDTLDKVNDIKIILEKELPAEKESAQLMEEQKIFKVTEKVIEKTPFPEKEDKTPIALISRDEKPTDKQKISPVSEKPTHTEMADHSEGRDRTAIALVTESMSPKILDKVTDIKKISKKELSPEKESEKVIEEEKIITATEKEIEKTPSPEEKDRAPIAVSSVDEKSTDKQIVSPRLEKPTDLEFAPVKGDKSVGREKAAIALVTESMSPDTLGEVTDIKTISEKELPAEKEKARVTEEEIIMRVSEKVIEKTPSPEKEDKTPIALTSIDEKSTDKQKISPVPEKPTDTEIEDHAEGSDMIAIAPVTESKSSDTLDKVSNIKKISEKEPSPEKESEKVIEEEKLITATEKEIEKTPSPEEEDRAPIAVSSVDEKSTDKQIILPLLEKPTDLEFAPGKGDKSGGNEKAAIALVTECMSPDTLGKINDIKTITEKELSAEKESAKVTGEEKILRVSEKLIEKTPSPEKEDKTPIALTSRDDKSTDKQKISPVSEKPTDTEIEDHAEGSDKTAIALVTESMSSDTLDKVTDIKKISEKEPSPDKESEKVTEKEKIITATEKEIEKTPSPEEEDRAPITVSPVYAKSTDKQTVSPLLEKPTDIEFAPGKGDKSEDSEKVSIALVTESMSPDTLGKLNDTKTSENEQLAEKESTKVIEEEKTLRVIEKVIEKTPSPEKEDKTPIALTSIDEKSTDKQKISPVSEKPTDKEIADHAEGRDKAAIALVTESMSSDILNKVTDIKQISKKELSAEKESEKVTEEEKIITATEKEIEKTPSPEEKDRAPIAVSSVDEKSTDKQTVSPLLEKPTDIEFAPGKGDKSEDSEKASIALVTESMSPDTLGKLNDTKTSENEQLAEKESAKVNEEEKILRVSEKVIEKTPSPEKEDKTPIALTSRDEKSTDKQKISPVSEKPTDTEIKDHAEGSDKIAIALVTESMSSYTLDKVSKIKKISEKELSPEKESEKVIEEEKLITATEKETEKTPSPEEEGRAPIAVSPVDAKSRDKQTPFPEKEDKTPIALTSIDEKSADKQKISTVSEKPNDTEKEYHADGSDKTAIALVTERKSSDTLDKVTDIKKTLEKELSVEKESEKVIEEEKIITATEKEIEKTPSPEKEDKTPTALTSRDKETTDEQKISPVSEKPTDTEIEDHVEVSDKTANALMTESKSSDTLDKVTDIKKTLEKELSAEKESEKVIEEEKIITVTEKEIEKTPSPEEDDRAPIAVSPVDAKSTDKQKASPLLDKPTEIEFASGKGDKSGSSEKAAITLMTESTSTDTYGKVTDIKIISEKELSAEKESAQLIEEEKMITVTEKEIEKTSSPEKDDKASNALSSRDKASTDEQTIAPVSEKSTDTELEDHSKSSDKTAIALVTESKSSDTLDKVTDIKKTLEKELSAEKVSEKVIEEEKIITVTEKEIEKTLSPEKEDKTLIALISREKETTDEQNISPVSEKPTDTEIEDHAEDSVKTAIALVTERKSSDTLDKVTDIKKTLEEELSAEKESEKVIEEEKIITVTEKEIEKTPSPEEDDRAPIAVSPVDAKSTDKQKASPLLDKPTEIEFAPGKGDKYVGSEKAAIALMTESMSTDTYGKVTDIKIISQKELSAEKESAQLIEAEKIITVTEKEIEKTPSPEKDDKASIALSSRDKTSTDEQTIAPVLEKPTHTELKDHSESSDKTTISLVTVSKSSDILDKGSSIQKISEKELSPEKESEKVIEEEIIITATEKEIEKTPSPEEEGRAPIAVSPVDAKSTDKQIVSPLLEKPTDIEFASGKGDKSGGSEKAAIALKTESMSTDTYGKVTDIKIISEEELSAEKESAQLIEAEKIITVTEKEIEKTPSPEKDDKASIALSSRDKTSTDEQTIAPVLEKPTHTELKDHSESSDKTTIALVTGSKSSDTLDKVSDIKKISVKELSPEKESEKVIEKEKIITATEKEIEKTPSPEEEDRPPIAVSPVDAKSTDKQIVSPLLEKPTDTEFVLGKGDKSRGSEKAAIALKTESMSTDTYGKVTDIKIISEEELSAEKESAQLIEAEKIITVTEKEIEKTPSPEKDDKASIALSSRDKTSTDEQTIAPVLEKPTHTELKDHSERSDKTTIALVTESKSSDTLDKVSNIKKISEKELSPEKESEKVIEEEKIITAPKKKLRKLLHQKRTTERPLQCHL